MSQSLAKAIRYITSPKELQATLRLGTVTSDLVVPSIFTGTNTVKYQHIEFDDYSLDDYNQSTGYAVTGIVATWKDLILTQDKGNALVIDKFEDEEAMANGLVTYVNKYILEVQAPAVDAYRFGAITSKTGIFKRKVTLASNTVLQEVLKAFAIMEDANINTDFGMILYVNPTIDALLTEAAIGKGYISIGNWNGIMDASVRMFKTAKIVVAPQKLLGTGVNFILLHKNAVAAFEKYKETVYFDQIPGHGGRKAEADIGIYHDCFVYDELVKAIYECTVATHSISFDASSSIATGTMATLTNLNEGSFVKLPLNAFKVTGYTFKGWDTTAYNESSHPNPAVVYEDGAIVQIGQADLTLYAVWEQDAS